MTMFQRAGTLRSVAVGDIRVSYVPDGAVKMVPRFLFPGTSDGDWAENAEFLDSSGWLTISSGALLIERGQRAVLIDAGFGPYPEPVSRLEYGIARMYGGGLLDNLRALGRQPGDIEAIAITHLHVEHVGWAGDPAFAHSACLLSQTEWDNREAEYGVTEDVLAAIAPRFRPVADGDEILTGVTTLALPGHTPGQIGFEVAAGGERLLSFADVLHSPVQVTHPDWALAGDLVPQESAATRHAVLGRLADQRALGFGIHFADAGFGTVRRTGTGFGWEPLASAAE
jgi:glyoxylase-like metal-dependent hydrolase (beta-lactamase superfamily II)